MRLLEEVKEIMFFPAKHFVTNEETMKKALVNIEKEMNDQVKKFEKEGKLLEADRIKRRTMQDIAMMREVGYCSGIENYSRHLSGKKEGEAPETLISYFPKNIQGERDFLTIIDESHVTLPQLHAMYAGDRARKENLVKFGFRLPSALDNRPLRYEEFKERVNRIIYVSATPSEREIQESQKVVEQIIRPTGLIDPKLEIKPVLPTKKDILEKKKILKKALIYIPGMSPVDKDFEKDLEEKAEKENYKLFIFKFWKDAKDLEEKSLSEIENAFSEFYKNIKKEKFDEYSLIAKSFGGCFALLYDLFDFTKVCLWAPAGGVSDFTNLRKIKDLQLKNILNIDDIKIGLKNLQKIKAKDRKIALIVGTHDKVVKIENQKIIHENIKKSEYFEIEEMGHTPKDKNESENLLNKTFEFLNAGEIKEEKYNNVSGFPNYPGQVEDFIEQTEIEVKKGGRVICTTLTKKMAEDLSNFLKDRKIKAEYLHSDIKTIERIQILTRFRKGEFDCLVGVNLLREGLDLPEVTLIGIFDADKEGFLRSETSLVQTIGRAARNAAGRVILYADIVTGSLERAIKETERRRKIQEDYNKENNITPKTILKTINDITKGMESLHKKAAETALDTEIKLGGKKLSSLLRQKEKEMKIAAKDLDFETAAILRDEIKTLNKMLEDKKDKSDKKK
jgi:superfamily II DNA or RNA helicase